MGGGFWLLLFDRWPALRAVTCIVGGVVHMSCGAHVVGKVFLLVECRRACFAS